MENKNSTNTPRTAEVRLPGDKLQNEKKMRGKRLLRYCPTTEIGTGNNKITS